MTAAALSLQEAMRETLLANAPLLALLGGGHIYDELPRGAAPSYVAFGEIETRDWSTASDPGQEHFVTVLVRSNQRSRKLAQEIADAVAAALDGAALALTGHRLVNLRLVFWTVARDRTTEGFGATLRFRAATEPL